MGNSKKMRRSFKLPQRVTTPIVFVSAVGSLGALLYAIVTVNDDTEYQKEKAAFSLLGPLPDEGKKK